MILPAAWLAQTPAARPAPSAPADPDTDGDGLSDYAEVHKYFTDPHKPTSAAERNEFTYTITSVMQFAKPSRAADMTDDYQDARVVAEDADSITMEIVYYPLNTNSDGVGENPNWRRDYAGMTEYLRPTATENWDGENARGPGRGAAGGWDRPGQTDRPATGGAGLALADEAQQDN